MITARTHVFPEEIEMCGSFRSIAQSGDMRVEVRETKIYMCDSGITVL